MKTWVLLGMLAPAAAHPTFDARAAAATAAISTRAGFIYDTAMVPAIHAALQPCVPKGTNPARGGGFALVADVDASGRLHDVEVRPASPIARCFAKTFGATRLRPPPVYASHAWPILVRMRTDR